VTIEALTPIYGPRPRCKRKRQRDESVCANLSGFNLGLLPRAIMDIRPLLSSITRRPQKGPWSRTRLQKCRWNRFSIRPFRLANLEHAPGHAREFCGEGNNQDIGVEPLGRCLQPGSEAMPRPTLTLQKYGSSALNEQRSQVPITAPRYAPENGSIAGRDLLRYETKPCCKVSALMEGITGSDGGDHRA
jgi:hypothetical protein